MSDPSSTDTEVICGAIKLVPLALMKTSIPSGHGLTHMAMTCVREPGHPERDADPSLHLCGQFAWSVGPGDDYRQTDEYKQAQQDIPPSPVFGDDFECCAFGSCASYAADE